MREFLSERGFIEVETPTLIKSTPEGARDFLVPSSSFPGNFYALPQSPQQMKQLLMVAGIDRYFQVARCFRDEPQRADRQPEFTQLDVEMSFVHQEDVMALIEELYVALIERYSNKHIQQKPFPRLTFAEAMGRFGSDRPDLRFGLELHDVSEALRQTGFRAFAQTLAAGGQVKALIAPGCAGYSRREIEALTKVAVRAGAKGLATIALDADGVKSPIGKFLSQSEVQALTTDISASSATSFWPSRTPRPPLPRPSPPCALSSANPHWPTRMSSPSAGSTSSRSSNRTGRRSLGGDAQPFLRVPRGGCGVARRRPGPVRAKQYDLVGNGNELGGGSVRTTAAPIKSDSSL